MNPLPFNRIPRPVRWIGGVVVILALLVLCLGLINWNAARGPLSRALSHHLDRQITIGSLRVHLFSSTPSADIENLTIANPQWAGGGNMVELPRLHVAVVLSQLFLARLVLQTLELDNPKVALLRQENGRANWDFNQSPKSKSQKPTRLPPLRHFALRGGSLAVDDAIRKLTFNGVVGAMESGGGKTSAPFQLQGQGTLNKEPFKLTFHGDALLDIKLDHPYRFQADIDAGPSNARIGGSIAKPFDFGGIDADIQVRGQNLANLYYLTNLALPLTPPYQLSVHLHRDGNHFALDDLTGKIGSSDMRGKGTVDLADKDGRPRLTATLASRSLNLEDLGVAFGAGVPQPDNGNKPTQTPAPQQQPVSPLLMPVFEFQFDRLRAMDAAVDFRADSIQAEKVPIKNVSFKLKLDHGVLNIDPVDFELPAGRLAGQIRLTTGNGPPDTSMDIRLSDIHLDQFKSKKSTQAPLDGVMQGRLRLEGHGNSVHAIAAHANGTISAVIPHGEMREAFAELTGIDMLRGLGLLLDKKEQNVAIRCGIAEFELKDGDAQAQRLLFDTQNVLVTGNGHITLNDEKLDLNLQGKPKKLRFGRLRSPINIRGTLRHPTVGLSTQAVVKQGAVAAALATIGTPIAAALAFIDPGLAKDADCAGLTDEAQDKVAQPPAPSAAGKK
ncbi:MAG TPA: AsmA family protein [Steroidobacteraceae bacterium]|jgi:hypothetical protein